MGMSCREEFRGDVAIVSGGNDEREKIATQLNECFPDQTWVGPNMSWAFLFGRENGVLKTNQTRLSGNWVPQYGVDLDRRV